MRPGKCTRNVLSTAVKPPELSCRVYDCAQDISVVSYANHN